MMALGRLFSAALLGCTVVGCSSVIVLAIDSRTELMFRHAPTFAVIGRLRRQGWTGSLGTSRIRNCSVAVEKVFIALVVRPRVPQIEWRSTLAVALDHARGRGHSEGPFTGPSEVSVPSSAFYWPTPINGLLVPLGISLARDMWEVLPRGAVRLGGALSYCWPRSRTSSSWSSPFLRRDSDRRQEWCAEAAITHVSPRITTGPSDPEICLALIREVRRLPARQLTHG